jgi:hypothetical protein
MQEGNMWYAVTEVTEISKWEALRILIAVDTVLCFPERMGGAKEFDRQIAWRSHCTIHEAMFRLLRECEDAYLDAFAKSLGLPSPKSSTTWTRKK